VTEQQRLNAVSDARYHLERAAEKFLRVSDTHYEVFLRLRSVLSEVETIELAMCRRAGHPMTDEVAR
jgi:hypothetical protein